MQFVENLVVSNIAAKNCLILVALPMTGPLSLCLLFSIIGLLLMSIPRTGKMISRIRRRFVSLDRSIAPANEPSVSLLCDLTIVKFQLLRIYVGVLTKPDCLPPGSTRRRQDWLDIIEGRAHVLTHGYYVTCQPDDDARERGISGEAARDAEDRFFRNEPWNTSTQSTRFGTRNLTQKLSRLLTEKTLEAYVDIVFERFLG